jgi:hypothetical protein
VPLVQPDFSLPSRHRPQCRISSNIS